MIINFESQRDLRRFTEMTGVPVENPDKMSSGTILFNGEEVYLIPKMNVYENRKEYTIKVLYSAWQKYKDVMFDMKSYTAEVIEVRNEIENHIVLAEMEMLGCELQNEDADWHRQPYVHVEKYLFNYGTAI